MALHSRSQRCLPRRQARLHAVQHRPPAGPARTPPYPHARRAGRILFHGVHHVALLCESLERSLDFYCGVLGLEVGGHAGERAASPQAAGRWSLAALPARMGGRTGGASPMYPAMQTLLLQHIRQLQASVCRARATVGGLLR